jgi:RES domain-containing protein
VSFPETLPRLTVWRIVNHKHEKTAFTGEGARLYGGRWNSPGTPMVYAAQSQSLAILEMLVHLDSPELLKKYVLFGVEIDADLITALDWSLLPKDWQANPVPANVQAVGDAWIASRSSLALSVPSALVPGECNFLLNPLHPKFSKLKIRKPVPFQFDPRLAVKRR